MLQAGRKQNRGARPAAAKLTVSAAKLDSVLEQVEHIIPETEEARSERKKPAAVKTEKQPEEAQPEQAADKQPHDARRTNRPRRRKSSNPNSGTPQGKKENHSRQPRNDRRQNAAKNSEHTERLQQGAKHDFVDANRVENLTQQDCSERSRRRPRRRPHNGESKAENKQN